MVCSQDADTQHSHVSPLGALGRYLGPGELCPDDGAPSDQIIDLCAFNGDLDKIAGYLCNQDCSKEACEIRDDPPELSPRSVRGSCSPSKEGEDAEEKLLLETIKRNNTKLLKIYET